MDGRAEVKGRRLTVSVVIATRDRPELVKRVATQVMSQLSDGDELVIVNDSTSGASVADQMRLAARMLASHGRGPAAARNLGWRAAIGDVVAFTDDDVRLDGAWLETMRAAFIDDERLIGIEGRTNSRPFDTLYEYSVSSDKAWNGLTCNVAYRREALKRLDGFDEMFQFAHCEDVDLFTRAKRMGSVKFAGDAIVEHEPRAVDPAVFTRRGRWLVSEQRLFTKHPEIKPFPLPAAMCAVILYVRWPIHSWFRHGEIKGLRDLGRLRRSILLTILWWWNVARAVPTLTTRRH